MEEKDFEAQKRALPLDLDAFAGFVDEFSKESDRAAVILGVAKLDTLLYQILGKVLVPISSSNDEFLDGDTPMGSFSARIHLVYRLGLINTEFARALQLCRKIRNSFAHELGSNDLGLGSHRDRVKELTAPFLRPGSDQFSDFRKAFFKDSDTPGTNFRCVLAIMVVLLENLFRQVVPFSAENAHRLVPLRQPPSDFKMMPDKKPV